MAEDDLGGVDDAPPGLHSRIAKSTSLNATASELVEPAELAPRLGAHDLAGAGDRSGVAGGVEPAVRAT